MRWLSILLFNAVLFLAVHSFAADPSAGDDAWSEIVHGPKLPQRPLEWKQRPPAPAELADFNKQKAAAAGELADKLRAFYKQYPNHPKASEAWIKEQDLRKLAGVSAKPDAKATPAAAASVVAAHPTLDFKGSVNEAMERIRNAQAAGPEAGLGEVERSGRKLADAFPNETVGWELLSKAAQGFGGQKAKTLYSEIAAKAPSAQLKQSAARELAQLNAIASQRPPVAKKAKIGEPLVLAFTSTDGRKVNLTHMQGKVVLVDFWATWCGPCVHEIPNVRKTYKELHDQGFEVVGVSFDMDRNELNSFVAQNKMEWPQYFDGQGWTNAVNREFQIRAIPAMYLVDKKGNLRYTDAREDLAGKVRSLLAEN